MQIPTRYQTGAAPPQKWGVSAIRPYLGLFDGRCRADCAKRRLRGACESLETILHAPANIKQGRLQPMRCEGRDGQGMEEYLIEEVTVKINNPSKAA
jgi:hypothetical protein